MSNEEITALTEYSAGNSWLVGFYSGYNNYGYKYNAYVVRPAVAI